MKSGLVLIAIFSVVYVSTIWTASGVPVYEEEDFPYEGTQALRERRSPGDKGKVTLEVNHERDRNNRDHTQIRGEYSHKLYENKHGATVEASAFAERNHGGYGPKRDHGGMINVNIPFR